MMRKGFTLIELLIVIGIVAVLATVVVLTLNPAETLRQSRDSTRLAEVTSLDKAIGFAVTQNPDIVLGAANTVYVSLPDDTAPTSNCPNYAAFLPALASGWQYRCVNRANLQKIDGSGWLPINFTGLPVVPIDTLPVDKVNSANAQQGFYYTYAISGSAWEINAEMESTKYRWGGSADVESVDGGNTIVLFEKGSNLNALPKEANWRIGYEVKVPVGCADAFSVINSVEFYSRWTVPGSGPAAVVKLLYYPGAQPFNPGSFVQMAMYNNGATAPVRKRISDLVMVEGQGSGIWTSSTLPSPVSITLGSTYVFGFGPEDDGYDVYFGADNAAGGYCSASGATSPGYPPNPPTASWSASGFPLNDTVSGASDTTHYGVIGIYYSL